MIKDKVKEYWDNKPAGIFHSKEKEGSLPFFEEVRKKRYFVEYFIPEVAQFHKAKNWNMLEIGHGLGTDGLEFIRNGAKYTGIDISDKANELFTKRLHLYNYVAELHKIDITETNIFQECTFDFIYCWGVLMHMPKMDKAINIIYQLLKRQFLAKL